MEGFEYKLTERELRFENGKMVKEEKKPMKE
jgi:hypothetical protein